MASSPFQAIVVSVPRKSKRVASSLAAWFSALSTSWRSILLTMSNDESAMTAPSFWSSYVPYPVGLRWPDPIVVSCIV
ncbi:Uncharacterised protein [Mycobacteroides abscessus subsp. abscessus]|nr:Uncharacterised protein [Mycobacteroides abscessus subsp. abscessus]